MALPLNPRTVARSADTRALRAVLEGQARPSAAFAARFSAQGKGAGKAPVILWSATSQANGKFQNQRGWTPAARAQGKNVPAGNWGPVARAQGKGAPV